MNPSPHLSRRRVLISIAATSLGANAHADTCNAMLHAQGDINMVGNSLPVIQHMARAAEACSRRGAKVSFKVTPQARTEVETAFARMVSENPNVYQAAAHPKVEVIPFKTALGERAQLLTERGILEQPRETVGQRISVGHVIQQAILF